MKSRYWKITHKFGITVPKSVEDAFQIDTQEDNHLWQKSKEKEMGKARIAF